MHGPGCKNTAQNAKSNILNTKLANNTSIKYNNKIEFNTIYNIISNKLVFPTNIGFTHTENIVAIPVAIAGNTTLNKNSSWSNNQLKNTNISKQSGLPHTLVQSVGLPQTTTMNNDNMASIIVPSAVNKSNSVWNNVVIMDKNENSGGQSVAKLVGGNTGHK